MPRDSSRKLTDVASSTLLSFKALTLVSRLALPHPWLCPLVSYHLFPRLGAVKSKLGFRPPSLTSDVHKNLTLKVRSKNLKSARIKEVATTSDPLKAQMERIRAKDDELRIRRRRHGRSGGGTGYHEPGAAMDSSYLEYDDPTSLSSIKRSIRSGGRGRPSPGGRGGGRELDDDEWADDANLNVRDSALMRAKGGAGRDEEDEDSMDDSDDDDDDDGDDEDAAPSRTRPRDVVVGDDDDDDGEMAQARTKRHRHVIDDEE